MQFSRSRPLPASRQDGVWLGQTSTPVSRAFVSTPTPPLEGAGVLGENSVLMAEGHQTTPSQL